MLSTDYNLLYSRAEQLDQVCLYAISWCHGFHPSPGTRGSTSRCPMLLTESISIYYIEGAEQLD